MTAQHTPGWRANVTKAGAFVDDGDLLAAAEADQAHQDHINSECSSCARDECERRDELYEAKEAARTAAIAKATGASP